MIHNECHPQSNTYLAFSAPCRSIPNFERTSSSIRLVPRPKTKVVSGELDDYNLKELLSAGVPLQKIDMSNFDMSSIDDVNNSMNALAEQVNKQLKNS